MTALAPAIAWLGEGAHRRCRPAAAWVTNPSKAGVLYRLRGWPQIYSAPPEPGPAVVEVVVEVVIAEPSRSLITPPDRRIFPEPLEHRYNRAKNPVSWPLI